jgi:hypothetical protein
LTRNRRLFAIKKRSSDSSQRSRGNEKRTSLSRQRLSADKERSFAKRQRSSSNEETSYDPCQRSSADEKRASAVGKMAFIKKKRSDARRQRSSATKKGSFAKRQRSSAKKQRPFVDEQRSFPTSHGPFSHLPRRFVEPTPDILQKTTAKYAKQTTIEQPLLKASGRDREHPACGPHRGRVGSAQTPNEAAPEEQKGVVEVCDRLVRQARVAADGDLRLEPAYLRRDRRANHSIGTAILVSLGDPKGFLFGTLGRLLLARSLPLARPSHPRTPVTYPRMGIRDFSGGFGLIHCAAASSHGAATAGGTLRPALAAVVGVVGDLHLAAVRRVAVASRPCGTRACATPT